MCTRLFITSLITLCCVAVQAQTLSDAVQYSSANYTSTARSAGVGGAFSALGADLSAVAVNPGGLGEYKFGEYVFSFGIDLTAVDADLRGQSNNLNTSFSNLGALGYVSTNRHRSDSAIKYSSFVLSVNRFLNFSEKFEFNASTPGSIIERFQELANGNGLEDLGNFEDGLAYDADAISDVDNDRFYESDFDNYNGDVTKSQTVDRTGSGIEVGIGYGANINNKLSVGLSLGIPFFSYEEQKTYRESDEANAIDNFNNSEFIEFLETSGVGFNAKLGVIYKPQKNLRVSLAAHSPSFMLLDDSFTNDLTYNFDDSGFDFGTQLSPLGEFQYQLRTPLRVIGGAAYMFSIGKISQRRNEDDVAFAQRRRDQIRGFISGEVEYVTYNNAKFNLTRNTSDPFEQVIEDELNQQVASELNSGIIAKLGVEIAKKKLRYRAGVRYEPSIYRNSNNANIGISGGVGFRLNRVFIDIAGTYSTSEEAYTPYILANRSNEQIVNLKQNKIALDFTIGYKL